MLLYYSFIFFFFIPSSLLGSEGENWISEEKGGTFILSLRLKGKEEKILLERGNVDLVYKYQMERRGNLQTKIIIYIYYWFYNLLLLFKNKKRGKGEIVSSSYCIFLG